MKSIIEILRDQKKKMEGGKSMNPEVGAGKPYVDPTKKRNNSPGKVMKRGYTRHQMDEY